MNSAFFTDVHKRENIDEDKLNFLRRWFKLEFSLELAEWSEPEIYTIAKSNDTIIGRIGLITRQISLEGSPLVVAEMFLELSGISWPDKDINLNGFPW